MKKLFLCDPNKNSSCKKTMCKYNESALRKECCGTTNEEFAMRNEHDEPIEMRESSYAEGYNKEVAK